MSEINEASKDTARLALFGAIGTLVTYGVDSILPDLPGEVKAAVLVIVTALLVWVDSYIHNNKDIKAKGLVPF